MELNLFSEKLKELQDKENKMKAEIRKQQEEHLIAQENIQKENHVLKEERIAIEAQFQDYIKAVQEKEKAVEVEQIRTAQKRKTTFGAEILSKLTGGSYEDLEAMKKQLEFEKDTKKRLNEQLLEREKENSALITTVQKLQLELIENSERVSPKT